MILGCITWYSVGFVKTLDGSINRHKYIDILENNLWSVIVRHFPDEHYMFQDDNAHTDVENYKAGNHIH